MKTVRIAEYSFSIPDKWKEVTNEQFRFLAWLLSDTHNANEIKTKLFLFITGITSGDGTGMLDGKPYISLIIKSKKYNVPADEFAYTIDLLNWMFKEKRREDGTTYLEFRCNRIINPLPILKCGRVNLYGPSDGLTNITWGEYIFVETSMHYYSLTNNVAHLAKAASVLYREYGKKTDNDCRIPFNSDNCDYRVEIVKRAEMIDLLIFSLWYQACKTYIAETFDVFSGGGSLPTDNPFDKYIRMTTVIAQNDATKVESWLDTPLYIVLTMLDEQKQQSKKK